MTLVIHQVKSISRHVDNTVFRIYLLCEIDMCQGLTWTTLFQPIDVHICATVGLKTTMATCGWVLWNFGEKEHEWLLLFLALLSTGFESAGCDLLFYLVHWSDGESQLVIIMLIDRCFVWSPAKYFLKGPALFQTVSTANSPDGSLEQTICRVRLRYSCSVWSVPVRRQTTCTLFGLWSSGVQLFQEVFHIHHRVNISTTRVSSHSDYMYTRHLSERAAKRETIIQDRLSTFVIVKPFLIRYQHNLQLCLWQQIRTNLMKDIETWRQLRSETPLSDTTF